MTPTTCGDAMLVPASTWKPCTTGASFSLTKRVVEERTNWPGAQMSGLMRSAGRRLGPSSGPRLEKNDRLPRAGVGLILLPFNVTYEPTEMTWLAEPGDSRVDCGFANRKPGLNFCGCAISKSIHACALPLLCGGPVSVSHHKP